MRQRISEVSIWNHFFLAPRELDQVMHLHFPFSCENIKNGIICTT
jgi:hypothetical protein